MGGYLLLELALVLAISTFLLIGQFNKTTVAIEEANAVATAQYLQKLQSGVNKYYQRNVRGLKRSDAIPGFADPLRPTTAELITSGDLDPGFPEKSPLGLVFRNTLTRTGTCPASDDCRISGWAYSTLGFRDAEGGFRFDTLTSVLTYIGLDAGMALPESPELLTMLGGSTAPNPAGAVAGIVGIRIGEGSGLLPSLSQYYTLDGERPLTGSMNVNNNDINGVNNIQIGGTAVTNDLEVLGDTRLNATGTPGTACVGESVIRRNTNGAGLVVCHASIWQRVGDVVPGIEDGGPCTQSGMVGSDSTGVSFVCNGSYWSSLNTTANPGENCTPNGKTATSVGNREELVCKNGVYVRLANLLSRNIEVGRQIIADGTVVPKPTCDAGGAPAYSFHLTQSIVDVSVNPPRQAMFVSATDIGASWRINLKLKDHANTEYSANPYSITAVMKLECAY